MQRFILKKPSVLPSFRLSLCCTLLYLLFIVLIPLSGLFVQTAMIPWQSFVATVSSPRVVSAYRVSFEMSLIASLIDTVFGCIVAWVLVRYRFPMRRFMDAMIDIPFALPTAVAGIALSALLGPQGFIGKTLHSMGIAVAFQPAGIVIALMFVGLPFVVRTVQPVLEDMEKEMEEAAANLGASRLQTFYKILLPQLSPALMTGCAMAFARGIGEYGSVIFIAGNVPFVSEIAPLVIVTKLEEYDVAGATGIALVLLLASFAILLSINFLQQWSEARR